MKYKVNYKYKINLLDKNNKAIFDEVYKESDARTQKILAKAFEEQYFKLELYKPHISSISFNIVHAALLDYQKFSSKSAKDNDYSLIPLDGYTLKYIHTVYGDNAHYKRYGVYYTADNG